MGNGNILEDKYKKKEVYKKETDKLWKNWKKIWKRGKKNDQLCE